MLEIRHRPLQEGQSIKEAYDDLYQDTDLRMRDSFYLWLISLLSPEKDGDRILLDIACGQGRLVELAAQQGIRTIGTDFAIEGMLDGVESTPQAGWVVSDGEKIPMPDNCVDYITHIGSLEHYADPQQGANEIARVLKPGGRACILLPNAFGLFMNIRYVQRSGEIFDDEQPIQRYATRGTWETLLRRGGLETVSIHGMTELNFPHTAADMFWMAKQPRKVIRSLMGVFVPVNLANFIVFICTKGDEEPARDNDIYYPMLAY